MTMNFNFIEQVLLMVFGVGISALGLGYVVRVVFKEMMEYRRRQYEPLEKELKSMLNSCGEVASAMVGMIKSEMIQKNESSERYYEMRKNRKENKTEEDNDNDNNETIW